MLFSKKRTPLSTAGEWAIAFTATWFLGGLYLDGWAHNHVPELETFFTPWHAVFYSGFFAMVFSLLFVTWMNKSKKTSWWGAVPSGYDVPVIGTLIFMTGGIGDMFWHEILGVEDGIEALLSPTHLVLATGMTLMLSGGLASWWKRAEKKGQRGFVVQLPMILSATYVLSLLAFMAQYSHFIDLFPAGVRPDGDTFFRQALPISGYMIHFSLIMGVLFFIMKRGKPAFGAVTFMLTLNVLSLSLMRLDYFGESVPMTVGALFTGLIADIILLHLYPLEKNMANLRVFAFGVPAVFLSFYFSYLLSAEGVWWSIHMWAGSIFIAGATTLLLSFLVWPPAWED